MRCSNCGTENKTNSKFCGKCGSLLPTNINSDNSIPTPPPKKRSGRVLLIVIIASIVVVVCVIGFLVWQVFLSDSFPVLPFNTEPSTVETTVTDIEQSRVSDTENELEVNESLYENIVDGTYQLSYDELDVLQSELEEAEKSNGATVKMHIVSDMGGNLTDYAESFIETECGNDGVLIVVDIDNYDIEIATCGGTSKIYNEYVKDIIINAGTEELEEDNICEACEEIINQVWNAKELKKISGFKPVDDSEQVVYVKQDKNSKTKASLTLVDWSEDIPRILYEIKTVYVGAEGITSSPSENKSATPKGTFKIGFAFSNTDLNTNLDTVIVDSDSVWVDDPNSEYYNMIQDGEEKNPPYWNSAEVLAGYFGKGENNACILIEHNGNGYEKGDSGKGSAMFISGKKRNLTKSYGDVNITDSQMTELLELLDYYLNPYIVIY